MNRYFFLELLDENPALLKAVVRFNSMQKPAAADPLMAAAQAHSDLKTVLASRQKPSAGFWDFSEESRCLALFEPEAVSRLARIIAAAIYATEIARTVQRASVLALRDFLGADILRYALTRGRWQSGGHTAMFSRLIDESRPLPDRCADAAVLAVKSLSAGWPQELQTIVSERWSSVNLPHPGFAELITGDDRLVLWHFTKKLIQRELGAPWTNYFA